MTMKKQRRIINIGVFVLALVMGYITFFPGKHSLNQEIVDKFFPNTNVSKLFKVKDFDMEKYLYLKDKHTVEVYEFNNSATKIEKQTTIAFTEYWFSVENQGVDTYLVLLSNSKKKQVKLFDSDVRPLSSELKSMKN